MPGCHCEYLPVVLKSQIHVTVPGSENQLRLPCCAPVLMAAEGCLEEAGLELGFTTENSPRKGDKREFQVEGNTSSKSLDVGG